MPMMDEFRPAGRHTIARRFLEISPEDSILEVGCHTGYFMRRYLIGKARKVRGTDRQGSNCVREGPGWRPLLRMR
jgi:hypothetical protein